MRSSPYLILLRLLYFFVVYFCVYVCVVFIFIYRVVSVQNFLSTNMNMRDPKITAQLWEIVEGANAVDLDALNKKNTDKSTLNKENKPIEKGESLKTGGIKNGVSNGTTEESSTNGVSKNGITDDTKSELSNGESKKKSKKRKQKEVEEEEEEEEQEQQPKETKSAKKRRLKKTSGATEEPLAGEVNI